MLIGGKLVSITSRKSHMSFQLVPKSVTLNDLQRHNGPFLRYFTEFGSFWAALCRSGWRCHRKKFTFAISSPDEFLVGIGRICDLFYSLCMYFAIM